MALPDLQYAIQGLESALAADAVNPQPSYSVNGKQVSRNEYRTSLIEALEGLKKQVQAYQPYIIRTAHRAGT